VAAQDEGEGRSAAAQAGGFSLHAGVSIGHGQRAKRERLCRYVSRAPLAQDRLTLFTAAGRGKGGDSTEQGGTKQGAQRLGLPRHVALRWAQRLKRVFGIEIEACARYVARLKIVASIEEPRVIVRILAHRDRASGRAQTERALHAARTLPGQSAPHGHAPPPCGKREATFRQAWERSHHV